MTEPSGTTPFKSRVRMLEIWLPLAILALDQLTKAVVGQRLPLHSSVTVVPGFINFTHVRNTGAAFGILHEVDFPFKTAVIVAVATCGLIGVAALALRSSSEARWAIWWTG